MTYDALAALNWSTLKHLAVSPLALRVELDRQARGEPVPDSPALLLGRATHCLALEPAEWVHRYSVDPGKGPSFGDMRRKENKAARAAWLESPEGRAHLADVRDHEAALEAGAESLTHDEHEAAQSMCRALREHRVARELLSGGRAEVVVEWVDGLACKGRLDYIRSGRLIDLKTTRRASVRMMETDAARLLYHGQLAWYHDGAIRAGALPRGAPPPCMVMVQSDAPHDVAAGPISATMLDAGRRLYTRLLTQYAQCQAAGLYPGVAPDAIEWELPRWALEGDLEEEW